MLAKVGELTPQEARRANKEARGMVQVPATAKAALEAILEARRASK